LNQFSTDWRIKARVTKKTPLREWNNLKGSGCLLNLELMDKEGTLILATFFNEGAKKYDTILSENNVYLFSNGVLKISNKKFTSIKNDYCINFDTNAEVQEVDDD
jgi:replication factor A1